MARFKRVGTQFDRVRTDINDNFDEADRALSALRTTLDALIIEAGENSPEVIDARGQYELLRQRLDAGDANLTQFKDDTTAQLAHTMTQTEFDSWVATLLDGGPSIFFDSYNQLVSAYPDGAAGVALIRETDPARIYVWDGDEWAFFGEYQGVEVKDGTLTTEKFHPEIKGKMEALLNAMTREG